MFHNYSYILFHLLLILPQVALSKGKLVVLKEDTWSEILTGEWMVEFYAPWCQACQKLQPTWMELAEFCDNLNIKVANVDITVNPGFFGRFMITELPTIFHVKDGVFRQYREDMEKKSLLSFVEGKKWQSIEPVPDWRSPQSYLMTTMSLFFKLAALLHRVHDALVEKYGIPYWGAYILIGLLAMVVGALLLMLVLMTFDFFSPSKTGCQKLTKNRPKTPPEQKASSSGASNHNLQPITRTHENNYHLLQATVQLLQRGRVWGIYNLNQEPLSPPPPPDPQDVFVRYVASKLRQMDESQQMLSERLVSEVLFKGQMGLLSKKMRLSDEAMPNFINIE